MPIRARYQLAVGLLLLLPAGAAAQPDPPPPAPLSAGGSAGGSGGGLGPPQASAVSGSRRAMAAPLDTSVVQCLPPALQHTLEALGASSGVPDGLGYSWYPDLPVRGQRAQMGLSNYQGGLTAPVYTTDTDALFVNTAVRRLDVRTNAVLPVHRTPFPDEFWDAQVGGAYITQLTSGWSWGVYASGGSVSDRPFHSLAEATISALAFLRVPRGSQDGWLYYVVSTTHGQVGHNIPIPGIAYEFQYDYLSGVVGFPFLNVIYRPVKWAEFEFDYAALTDVLAQATYRPTVQSRVFIGFQWTNHSWFRADRPIREDQLFWYEKRLIGGFGWRPSKLIDFRVTGGYAFDRYFVENNGLSLSGRNRIDLAPGPFVATQLELKY